MNILASSFTLKYKSLDIYLSGCNGNPKCRGCHNPESWDFIKGIKYTKEYYLELETKVKDFSLLIDNIMIFGGEPLDQNHNELVNFLADISSLNKKIWLFTRYDMEEVPEYIKHLCDYIKTGRYIPELSTDKNIQYGIKLSTLNQQIYKLR